jgi:hypothetical protein
MIDVRLILNHVFQMSHANRMGSHANKTGSHANKKKRKAKRVDFLTSAKRATSSLIQLTPDTNTH